jgi:uncharacterized protein YggE
MNLENGVLRVTATETAEVEATRAKLHIRIEGETFVLGNAALTRSREVAELIAKLKTLGLTDQDAQVSGVHAKVNQGVLTKGSRAVFRLALTVRDLSKIPDYLGAITAVKHAELERLEWIFDDEAARLELSAQATKKALEKATVMASAVGHEIAGIRAISDSSKMPEVKDMSFGGIDWMTQELPRASRERKVDIGTEFKASREISATVTVDFVMVKTAS